VRWHRLAVLSSICLSAFVEQAHGQTFPFQLTLQQGTLTNIVPNGTTLDLVATGVGVASTFTLTAMYTGSTTAVIPTAPQVLGSTAFTVSPIKGLPLTLHPGGSVTLTVTYTPTTNAAAGAQLNLAFTQTAATATGASTSGTITLNIDGSVPQFLVSYALAANLNIITIASGGTIQFLPTTFGTTASATVIIIDQGSGAGTVTTLAVTGSAFQPVGLPLLPAVLASGGSLQFAIQYTPTAAGSNDVGGLTATFSDGSTFTAVIQGSGIGAAYAYTLINNGINSSITAGQTVSLPSIAVGQTESVMIQVQNTGNASGTISVIAVTGVGYDLANVPVLPLTLAPNATGLFTLSVTPTEAGPNGGALRVGNDVFNLATTGLGANLVYSYVNAGTTTPVLSTGTVLFSPVEVSQTSTLPFTVTNTGTSAALIASIGIGGSTATPFTLAGVPALPLSLQPGATITFSIVFAPVSNGQATGTLLVNAVPFTLLGFGTQPPALPAYQITGPSGSVGPSQQPTVGLTLSQAYALDLTGSLTIQVTPNSFAADPAIQFSTGGRTVAFTIAAGQTQAVFPNGSTGIRFQTGTVAGGITITPTFTTTTGLNLTPANPTQLQLTVPSLAPVLLTASISNQSATGFVVTLNGYVTSLSVSSLSFTFSVKSGAPSITSAVSLDVSQASAAWFGSSASASFGGQFSIAVPFTLQAPSGTNVTSDLQAVSATATNGLGVSNSVSTPFP
jgi:hypothetical protein